MAKDPADQRKLSPQEKKALSYARDGRNTYGENDKASRKNVPLRKRLVNRANRHADQQTLSRAEGTPDDGAAEAAEDRTRGKRPKVWKKQPDQRLGDYLAERDRRRQGR